MSDSSAAHLTMQLSWPLYITTRCCYWVEQGRLSLQKCASRDLQPIMRCLFTPSVVQVVRHILGNMTNGQGMLLAKCKIDADFLRELLSSDQWNKYRLDPFLNCLLELVEMPSPRFSGISNIEDLVFSKTVNWLHLNYSALISMVILGNQ